MAKLVAFVVASSRRVHLAIRGVLRFTTFEGMRAQDVVDTFALLMVRC